MNSIDELYYQLRGTRVSARVRSAYYPVSGQTVYEFHYQHSGQDRIIALLPSDLPNIIPQPAELLISDTGEFIKFIGEP